MRHKKLIVLAAWYKKTIAARNQTKSRAAVIPCNLSVVRWGQSKMVFVVVPPSLSRLHLKCVYQRLLLSWAMAVIVHRSSPPPHETTAIALLVSIEQKNYKNNKKPRAKPCNSKLLYKYDCRFCICRLFHPVYFACPVWVCARAALLLHVRLPKSRLQNSIWNITDTQLYIYTTRVLSSFQRSQTNNVHTRSGGRGNGGGEQKKRTGAAFLLRRFYISPALCAPLESLSFSMATIE